MRYAPPGLCLNDFAVIGAGPYHLLHLQGPWTEPFEADRLETSYGRASSVDLVSWEAHGPAFGVGRPGRFDDCAIWTMHPFPHGDAMAMAYTGVHRAPHPEQSVGFAVSDRFDGTGWRRVDMPPIRPDSRWYRCGPDEAWRDPWVASAPESGITHAMVVAARTAADPVGRSGCVGLAVSADLLSWEVQPPILVPGDVDELECPILERRADGGWLLLGSVGPEHEIRAWVAEHTLLGGWTPLGPIAPPGPYAPRIVSGPVGERLLLHTVARRTGLSDNGSPCRGMLAQPKVLDVGGDRVRLRWWPGLAAYLAQPIEPDLAIRDAVIEWTVDGPGTLAIRDDGGPDAVEVEVTDSSIAVRTRSGRLLQRAPLAGRLAAVRVLAVGEFLEVYVDDVLSLSTVDYSSGRGATQSKQAGVVTVRPIVPVDNHRDDASSLWPGPVA